MFNRRKTPVASPPDRLRERADAARDARDWRLAAALYEVHLGVCPADDRAALWVQLGHCRKEAGDLDGALEAYRHGLDLAPGRADTHLQTGHLHKVAGRPDQAAASYAEALRTDPRSADARAELIALGRGVDGEGHAAPEPGALRRADAARDAGRWSDAAALYADHLAADPDAVDAHAAWVQLGHARKEAGDRDGAVAAYEAALGLDPEDVETRVHLGHLHKDMGATGAAVEAFTKALRLAPARGEVARDLHDLTVTAAPPAVRRSPAAQRGEIRYALPLPWAGDRGPFQSAFPPIHAGLSRRFGPRDDAAH